MKAILKQLFNYHTLTKGEAKQVLGEIAEGKFHPNEVSAFLTVYKMRSISLDELTGFRDCLRERCLHVDLSDFDTIDMCGTGGDGKDTFNISTLASFVTASAGVPVAKHGNYGVSSTCGSSNVMEYLGYRFSKNPDQLKKQLEKCHITFLHAPLFHPAMKEVAPIRKTLGVPTFFNMLGPMVNPSFPKNQVVGVFSLELHRYYKYIYEADKTDFFIVHSTDGYDEVSLTSGALVSGNKGDVVLEPEDFGAHPIKAKEIFGGNSIKEAAGIFLKIIKGQGSVAQTNVVAANSALAIRCARPQMTIKQAFELARETLISGRAAQTFNKLITQ